MNIIQMKFDCSVCGATATQIELVPAGVIHPKAESIRLEDLGVYTPLNTETGGGLIIESVTGKRRTALGEAGVKEWQQVLLGEESEVPHRVALEWIPSYCPECRAHYCAKHWQMELVMEDDGWYDCTNGVCPHGHKRELDD